MEKEVSSGTVISFIIGIAFIVGWVLGVVGIVNFMIKYDFSFIIYVFPISLILFILDSDIKPMQLAFPLFMMMWSCSTILGSLYFILMGDFNLLTFALLVSSIILYVIDSIKVDNIIKYKNSKVSNKD